MSEAVIDIMWKEQLDALIKNSDGLVVADFWAERCAPCRMIGPTLHDLAEASAGKITIAKVNVDDPSNQQLAMDYSVRSIPLVTIFKGGAQVDQFVGALPPDQIKAYVNKHM